MKKGLFITFEGGEGTGKTTQIALLAQHLRSRGYEVVVTREPGGTTLGEEIRRHLVCTLADPPIPEAELLLYEADRAQHVGKIIRPAIEKGAVVLCDRYADATVAYQGHGRGLDLELIRTLNRAATGGLKPDRTILLDLDPGSGVSRAITRHSDDGPEPETRFENEEMEFHLKVRKGYALIAAGEPERVRRVEASGTVEEISLLVREALKDLFEGAPA